MAKEPIPNNFLTDTLRFLLRWGLRLILLLVALTALIGIIVFIFQKYDSWKNESVILVALKCGPTNVDAKDWPEFRFISLQGIRKDKVISKLHEIRQKSDLLGDGYSDWKESFGFELVPQDITANRDEYFNVRTNEDGVKTKTSINRKTLQRIITRSKNDTQTDQTFRNCEKISVREYEAELESVKKAFSEGNKI